MENFLEPNAFPDNQVTTEYCIFQIITYYLLHFTNIFIIINTN